MRCRWIPRINVIHDFFYLFLNITARRISSTFSWIESNRQCWTWLPFYWIVQQRTMDFFPFFRWKKRSETRKGENIFDCIVPIRILFKLHAFEKTVESSSERKNKATNEGIKQAVTGHNLWFLLAYLVMVKRLIGNLSNFT